MKEESHLDDRGLPKSPIIKASWESKRHKIGSRCFSYSLKMRLANCDCTLQGNCLQQIPKGSAPASPELFYSGFSLHRRRLFGGLLLALFIIRFMISTNVS